MIALAAAGAALGLGIVNALSPCPLATNVAAVSYLAGNLGGPKGTWRVLAGGGLYTLGRAAGYLLMGALITAGILSVPSLSRFLQEWMNRLTGPLLIVVGMVLGEMIPLRLPGIISAEKAKALADRGGLWGAGALGFLFSLALCPISAALFFGSLLPLAVTHSSPVLLPLLFGVGTALPVLAFAVLASAGAEVVGRAFRATASLDRALRLGTAAVFILAGIYLSLRYVWKFFWVFSLTSG